VNAVVNSGDAVGCVHANAGRLITPIGRLGISEMARGLLFDLDGVLTRTAKQHAAARKLMFDDFLARRAQETGQVVVPFDAGAASETYVDGKPRLAGTQSFLASRGIELPTGTPQDPPGAPTVHGLSNRKNALVVELVRTQGVTVYPGRCVTCTRPGRPGWRARW